METMFQMQNQQCPAEGNNNFPQPAGYGVINATVYEVILHHNKGGLTFSLTPARPQVLLCRAATQPGSHWPALLCEVAHFFTSLVPCQMHDFVFAFVHKAPVGQDCSSSLEKSSRMRAVPSAYQSLFPLQVSNIHRLPGQVRSLVEMPNSIHFSIL